MMEKATRHKNPAILDMEPMEQIFLSVLVDLEKEIVELRSQAKRRL